MWRLPWQPPTRVKTAPNPSETSSTCLPLSPVIRGEGRLLFPLSLLLALSPELERWRGTGVWRANPTRSTLRYQAGEQAYGPQSHGVLVRAGCYNKLPQIGWLIHNSNLFVIDLGPGCLRSGWSTVDTLLWVADFSLPFHTWWKGRASSVDLCSKALTLFLM